VNKGVFRGRLTKDIELRYTQAGTAVANFTLAVNRRFKQEGQPNADFLNFVAWGGTAEFLAKYFEKGSQLATISRVQTRNWEDDEGKKHYVTEFVAEEVYFAGNKGVSNNNGDNLDVPPDEDPDDDIPFN